MDYREQVQWLEDFRDEWDKRTKFFDPTDEKHDFYPSKDPFDDEHVDYHGIDFTLDNEWTTSKPLVYSSIVTYHYGDSYRKEVSPSDVLGSYQSSSFWLTIDDDRIVITKAWYPGVKPEVVRDDSHWHRVAWFNALGIGLSVKDCIDREVDLTQLPARELVQSFYQEVGTQY